MTTPDAIQGDIFHHDGRKVVSVTRARPGDTLVLLAVLPPARLRRPGSPAVLLEVYRGTGLRHQQTVTVSLTAPTPLAFRLIWTDRPGSARLTVVIRSGGRERFRRTVLLVPEGADAQGRLTLPPADGQPSDATAIEFLREFDRLLTDRASDGKSG